MNRKDRRALSRKLVKREGRDAESTRRVRARLASAMKSELHEEAETGVQPHITTLPDGSGVTESGLVVPPQSDVGIVVP